MNMNTLSADELIKVTGEVIEPSELEQALCNKIIEVKAELEKANDLLEKVANIVEAATDK